jgi:DNA-directed RNA polymerase specialized sigma24 family protein
MILCADRLESLRDHLEQLPDELRRCFLLRYHRGYGEAAIAVLMKHPVDWVKTCLEQARKSLGFDGEVS